MINRAAEDFARELDRQMMEDIEKETRMKQGWVKAPFTTENFLWPFEHRLDEVMAWIHVNATGEYRVFGKEFWFRRKKDLTAFILKWS